MEVNPAEKTEAAVEQVAVTKEIDESEESTPVVPSGEEETGAGDAPKPAVEEEAAVDSSSTEAPATAATEEPVANGNGEAETTAETKEAENAEESLKRKTDGEEEASTEVPEKRLKTDAAEEAAVVEDGEGAEEATA